MSWNEQERSGTDYLCTRLLGSAVQSVAEVDLIANSHWSSLEWALTSAQSEVAEFSLAAECVVGRLGGGGSALGAAAGWVCSATGAAG